MFDIEVQNIVASVTLGKSFDLDEICEILDGAEYEPEKFRGVIFKLRKPGIRTSVLIFGSGKMVCTGAKYEKEIYGTVEYLKGTLEDNGIDVLDEPDIQIQNIVATTDLEGTLNLTSLAISLGLEKTEYEPEQFPGLVYRMNDPKLVMLFFGSGKVVCTGGKNLDDIKKGVEKVHKELIKTGLLYEKNN
ncbi:MAG: TATA-box-binding protein [Candidatus Saliniplasma sp.]